MVHLRAETTHMLLPALASACPIGSGRGSAGACLLIAAAGVLPGCAGRGDVRELRVELGEVRAEARALHASVRELSARQDSLLRLLAVAEARAADSLRAQERRRVELRGGLSQRLRSLEEEVAVLGQVSGHAQRSAERLLERLDSLAAARPDRPGARAPADTLQDPAAIYEASMVQVGRGMLATAQMGFERLLEEHPEHEMVPRARFQLGNVLHLQELPGEALAAFDALVELHPDAPEAADALWRAAMIHLELGDETEGRRYLERILRDHPDADVAPLARRALGEGGGPAAGDPGNPRGG